MEINFLALLVAALSTFAVGSIWYHPRVFGTRWMKETGLTLGQLQQTNLFVLFGVSIIYALMISFLMQSLTIHQFGALGMIGGDPAVAKPSYGAFMDDYGTAFRTFKHGALHGFLSGLFLVLPIIGTTALHEKRSFTYIAVVSGYWIVSFMIMGGIICAWQ